MRVILLIAVAVALSQAAQVRAFEVYLDTNIGSEDGRSSQLFETKGWEQTAAKLNGIWFVAQGLSKAPPGVELNDARLAFLKRFARKRIVIELYHNFDKQPKTEAYEIAVLKKLELPQWTAMVYREDRPDSTLTEADLTLARAAFKEFGVAGHPIIVNTRAIVRNKALQELMKNGTADGFSLEFASFYADSFVKDEVATSIQAAVAAKKPVYLLMNADKTKKYLDDVQRIFAILHRQCPRELQSDLVKFVVANYEAGNDIQYLPEKTPEGKYANTVTGAALCLIDIGDKLKSRSPAPDAPPTAPRKKAAPAAP